MHASSWLAVGFAHSARGATNAAAVVAAASRTSGGAALGSSCGRWSVSTQAAAVVNMISQGKRGMGLLGAWLGLEARAVAPPARLARAPGRR